ncbi:MAG: transporter substrate-binding domain-containing protein [Bermanella sp.]
MHKYLSSLLFALMASFFVSPLSAAEQFTVFCNEKNVPVCYKDEAGKIVGIDVDIVRELSKRLELSLDIQLVPWKRVLAGVQQGTADAGMPLFVTEDRKKYSLYSQVPLHESVMVAYTKVGRLIAYSDLKDLYGKSVGIRRGYSISPEFDQLAHEGRIKVTGVNDVQNMIRMIEAGRFDLIIDKRSTVGFYLKQSGVKLQSIGQVGKAQGAYLVVSKATSFKNPKSLLNDIDKVLMAMKEEGVIEEITKRYTK